MQKHSRTVIQDSSESWIILAITAIALVPLGGCHRNGVGVTELEFAPQNVVTVCELFKDLGAYSGKRIGVRGIYYAGLRGKGCPEWVVAGGRAWPVALEMVDSASHAGVDAPVTFKTDRTSWENLDAEVIRQGHSGRRAEIWVTVFGQLKGPSSHWVPNSGITGGYGHLGAFPAEIIVERIVDVEVQSTPTYDYRRHSKYSR